jgi:hypothetical protein
MRADTAPANVPRKCTSSQKQTSGPPERVVRYVWAAYRVTARRPRIRTASMRFSRTDSTRIE